VFLIQYLDVKKLSILKIQRSTVGEETSIAKSYAFKIFKEARQLESVDGLKNPFGKQLEQKRPKQLKKIDTVMVLEKTNLKPLNSFEPTAPSAPFFEDDENN